MSVRKAQIEDAPSIDLIEQQVQSSPWSLTQIRAQLLIPEGTNLVWSEGQELRSYILARKVAESEFEILQLATHPQHLRKGFANRVMEEFLRQVGGGSKVFLEVSKANLPAQKLYKSFGFQLVGERKNYYRDGSDALILALTKTKSS